MLYKVQRIIIYRSLPDNDIHLTAARSKLHSVNYTTITTHMDTSLRTRVHGSSNTWQKMCVLHYDKYTYKKSFFKKFDKKRKKEKNPQNPQNKSQRINKLTTRHNTHKGKKQKRVCSSFECLCTLRSNAYYLKVKCLILEGQTPNLSTTWRSNAYNLKVKRLILEGQTPNTWRSNAYYLKVKRLMYTI